MLLSDVHIVDLNQSEWDKDRSEPEKGRYYFTKKVYSKSSDYRDDAIRPKHVLKWIMYDKAEDFATMNHYRSKYNAETVIAGDPYWPEPLVPDSEGKYVFPPDTILVKIPLEIWVEKLLLDKQNAKRGHEMADRQFKSETMAESAELDVDIS